MKLRTALFLLAATTQSYALTPEQCLTDPDFIRLLPVEYGPGAWGIPNHEWESKGVDQKGNQYTAWLDYQQTTRSVDVNFYIRDRDGYGPLQDVFSSFTYGARPLEAELVGLDELMKEGRVVAWRFNYSEVNPANGYYYKTVCVQPMPGRNRHQVLDLRVTPTGK